METQEQSCTKYKRNTELRFLDPKDVYQLGLKLDKNDYWKKLMQIIPKRLDAQKSSEKGQLNYEEAWSTAGGKYNNDHISLIENATKRSDCTKLFTETLFDEWSTSGRKNERPTVGILLELLTKAEIFSAADFVAMDFLGEPPPDRPPGPGCPIHIKINSKDFKDIDKYANDSGGYPETEDLFPNLQLSNSAFDNNKDYFSKYRFAEKDVNPKDTNKPIPPPRERRNSRPKKLDQNQQSANGSTNSSLFMNENTTTPLNRNSTPSNGTFESIPKVEQERFAAISENIPNLTELMTSPASLNNSNPSPTSNTNSTATSANTETTQLSASPLPNLSVFTSSKSGNSNSQPIRESNFSNSENNVITSDFNEIIPDISELNLNGVQDLRQNETNSESPRSERSDSNLSREMSSDEDLSYQNDSKEDDAMPDLSALGERRSNNDSSLTSVTGTSGENSFEQSTNESSSASNDDNIPFLSILNQNN